MIRALYTSQTGMQAQQLQLDVTSNNLANVNTSAFKKSRAQFEDLMYQNMRAAGAETAGGGQVPTGIQVGLGTRTTAVQKIFTQGDYTQTSNDLDMAIEGKGFFQIIRDGQEYYTRAGAFTKDSDGYIVNQNGDRLQPEFSVPDNTATLSIDSGGMVSAMDSAQQILGSVQLTVHTFVNPGGLNAAGGNLYLPTEASGAPVESNPGTDAAGSLAQGYLEMSNVSVTEEMVNLIITQRAFDVNSKGISTADRILETTNNLVR